jgi:transposase-like protein
MANRGAILLSIFKRRRFPVAIILLCVRWYCKYGISYRDLAEMMSERGVSVNPSTIFRWVQRYAPEIEKRVRPYQGHRSGSWRVMRPMYEWAEDGSTCFERSINTDG